MSAGGLEEEERPERSRWCLPCCLREAPTAAVAVDGLSLHSSPEGEAQQFAGKVSESCRRRRSVKEGGDSIRVARKVSAA